MSAMQLACGFETGPPEPREVSHERQVFALITAYEMHVRKLNAHDAKGNALRFLDRLSGSISKI